MLFIFIPVCMMFFSYLHIYSENKDNYFFDRLLPVVVSLSLLGYLARQHYLYWDNFFFKKPYISKLNGTIAFLFGFLLLIVLYKIDLKLWYAPLVPSASTFFFLPFIISGYALPLLLFSHIFADSLEMSRRIKYIGSAYFIIIVCFLFYWVRYSDIIS